MINKGIIWGTVITITLMIGVPSYIEISKEHKNNLLQVSEKRIIEAAANCFKDETCITPKAYFKDLYDNNYLTSKEYDPFTKEVYSEESYVEYLDNELTINYVYNYINKD